MLYNLGNKYLPQSAGFFLFICLQGSTLAGKTTTNIQGPGAVQATLVKASGGSSIVVKTQPANGSIRFAAINKRMQQSISATPGATLTAVVSTLLQPEVKDRKLKAGS